MFRAFRPIWTLFRIPQLTSVAGLTVQRVVSEPEFDALEPAWTALYASAGTSPFQSFPWLRTWWRHYGEDDPHRRLDILVVTERGMVIAIAPFFRQRTRIAGVLPITELALIGRPRSDYLDLLVAPESASASLDMLAAYLSAHRNKFDVLVMEDVPDHSSSLSGWLEALRRHGFTYRQSVSNQCPRVTFAATWEETEAALPPETRGKMRRRLRHLATRHDAWLEPVTEVETLDADLSELMELHQRRWTAIGLPGVFGDRQYAAFFRDAAHRMSECGQFWLAFLRIDGRRAAAVSGFRHGDEFHFYHGGTGDFGAEAARYSPGIALHLLAMQALFPSGVRTYDLLRGVERYKLDLGGVPVTTWRVVVPGRRRELGRWPYLAQQVLARVEARLTHERRLMAALRNESGTSTAGIARHVGRRLAANGRDVSSKLRRLG